MKGPPRMGLGCRVRQIQAGTASISQVLWPRPWRAGATHRLWDNRLWNTSSWSQQVRRLQTAGLSKHALERPTAHTLSAEDADALVDLAAKLSCQISGDDTTLRGTEISHDGAVSRAEDVLTKDAIVKSYSLHGRDLRNIDLNSKSVPYVFVRPETIVVNLFALRLLIQHNRILVLAPPDNVPATFATQIRDLYISNLQRRLEAQTSQPFELRALEAALITVVCSLEAEYLLARDPASAALRALQDKVDVERYQLQDLLHHSRRMTALESRARLVRDALQELLNNDDDLAEMYLTDTNAGNPHKISDHTEAEVLLEAYCKVCDQVVEAAGAIRRAIEKTEDNLKSILDAHRNQIMLLDVRLNVGMLGLSSGTLLAGLYGMNVAGIERFDWGFPAMSGCCFGLTVLFALYGARRIRKLNSVKIDTKVK